ncbi:hypothetical protein DRQ53_08170 [bacterium]|nr:MAG: hypothetical protein DRQ32_02460 [bacterium]RKZ15771.1 MAG: hypothetical protein DRQ53_08170 [bacterium]
MRSRLCTWLLIVVSISLTPASAAAEKEFGAWWYDGKAELNGYRLTVSRYGETRSGTSVMIYVTEPFSESGRVKVNDHTKNPEDTFGALKLNLVRDFQTGIYDYNTMVSTFVRDTSFEPVKVSFTSAEWCGHVYEELVFGQHEVRGTYHSYFEGESGAVELQYPQGGVAEDNLFILLRGLRKDYLEPGESRSVDYLPGVFHSRLAHQELQWTRARIERAVETVQVAVPAGGFDTVLYTIEIDGGRTGSFHIEASYPHRIVKWSLSPDIEGVLTGSTRLAYWGLNGEGQESHLDQIGLGQ